MNTLAGIYECVYLPSSFSNFAINDGLLGIFCESTLNWSSMNGVVSFNIKKKTEFVNVVRIIS